MIVGKLFHTVMMLAIMSSVASASACKHLYASKKLEASSAKATKPPSALLTMTTAIATQVHVAETSAADAKAAKKSTTKAFKATKVNSAPTISQETSASEVFWGVGTRYGLSDGCTEEDCWQDGACSFVDYDLPSALDGSTCISTDIWAKGANCGGCIAVTYKGKTLKIMVTNATGGNGTHLDMTPSTWSKLTNGYTGGGVDGIQWEWITCPIPETSPLQVRMHNGASKYWFSATIENARLRIGKVEVSSDQGSTWKATSLHDPNMYVLDGNLPDDTAWVRVTSINGRQVVIKDVPLESGKVTKATENFA